MKAATHPELLEECLDDAVRELEGAVRESVAFGNGLRRFLAPAGDVMYLSSSGNYIVVRTLRDSLRLRDRLSRVAEHLPPQFVLVHRGDVVNVRHIFRLETAEVVMHTMKCAFP